MTQIAGPRRWYRQVRSPWEPKITFAPNGPRLAGEVMVGCTPPEGESWEIGLRWYQLSPDYPPVLRIEMYDDAFAAFSQASDFLAALEGATASGDSPALVTVTSILDALGFSDITDADPSAA